MGLFRQRAIPRKRTSKCRRTASKSVYGSLESALDDVYPVDSGALPDHQGEWIVDFNCPDLMKAYGDPYAVLILGVREL